MSLVTPLDAPHRNFIIARACQASALFAVVTPVGLSRQGKERGGGELRMKIVYEKDDSLSNKNQPGLIIIINFIADIECLCLSFTNKKKQMTKIKK